MALIDVSELLSDPDFIDPFQVIRRSATVDSKGKNILTESAPIDVEGSVQAGDGDTLKRLPDGAQLSSTITIYTQTPIYADPVGGYGDIILWKGQRYQVENSMPWDNYGGGYFRVDCIQEKPSI